MYFLTALYAAQIAFCAQTAEMYPVSDNVRGHENTEWSQSYAYHLTDAKKDLPRVLLVGDSLFRLLDPLDRKSAWRDDYHFTAGTSADIARRVADCVLEAAGLAPRCVSGGIRPVTGESPRKPQERH